MSLIQVVLFNCLSLHCTCFVYNSIVCFGYQSLGFLGHFMHHCFTLKAPLFLTLSRLNHTLFKFTQRQHFDVAIVWSRGAAGWHTRECKLVINVLVSRSTRFYSYCGYMYKYHWISDHCFTQYPKLITGRVPDQAAT